MNPLFCIILLGQVVHSKTDFVCKSTADSIFDMSSQSCKDAQERMKALEDQVSQLQKLVSGRDFHEVRNRFSGMPTDCGVVYSNGTTRSGVYLIAPAGRCPFKVFCDMTDDGWTVIQRRLDGSVNFYRPWDEYVEGFGDIDGEYWLGLEKIHRLTKDGYEIYFDIENYDGTKEHAHYKTFTVHDASSLYRMNVDAFGYIGTLQEAFSYHDNQKFTTFDRDNDAHARINCAVNYAGSAWWYKDCYRLAIVNGIFEKKSKGGISYHDSSKDIFFRSVTIKVRHKRGFC